MKSDVNGNGRKEMWPSEINTGSYSNLTSTAASNSSSADDERIDVGGEALDQGALDPDTNQRRKRRRRKIVGVLIILLFVTGVSAGMAYYLIRGTNLDVIIGGRNRDERGDRAGGDNNLTQQAIKEAREVTKSAETAPTPQLSVAPSAATSTDNLAGTITGRPTTASAAEQGTGAVTQTDLATAPSRDKFPTPGSSGTTGV